MNQTMFPTPCIRPSHVRPETESVLRDLAFVLTLARRICEEIQREGAQR